MKNVFFAAFFSISAFLIIPGLSTAATFDGGEIFTLSGAETIEDNLYVGAGDVTIAGSVAGDLLVGGGSVVLSGNVRDDLAAAGGNVSVLGPIGGDARIAGGNLLIDSSIGGDLVVAGGTIKTLDTVSVGKDLSLFGGYVVFNGTAAGDALLAGGEIIINGVIEGDVLVEVNGKLTLGENAQINGALVYKGASEDLLIQHDQAIITGGVHFEEKQYPQYKQHDVEKGLAAFLGALLIIKLLVVAVAAVALVLLFKRFSQSVVSTAMDSFLMNVLRGFIVLVMIPVSAMILLVTLFGAYLGLLLLATYLLVLMLASIYSGILFGAWLMKLVGKARELTWWHALLGVILLGLVEIIPVLGWIIGLVFFLAVLGSFLQLFRGKVWANR